MTNRRLVRRLAGVGVAVVLISQACGATPAEPEPQPPPPPPPVVPPPNRAPVVRDTIPPQTVGTSETISVDVARYFTDPDGDTLTYEATSSNTTTLAASISGDALTLTGVEAGTASVSVIATDPHGAAASQAAAVTVHISDRDILRALYVATGGDDWTRSDNWLSGAPHGEWYGVQTDEAGNIVSLKLASNGLSGSIPRELGDLTGLIELDLTRNNLYGPIPPEVGDLASLTRLSLQRNNLSGLIPPELGSLAGLTRLNLERNNLSGPVPPELGDLADLTELYLRENALSGPIPPEFMKLAGLAGFHFEANPGLCAPGTPQFVAWLAEMDRHDGPYCNAGDRDALEAIHAATGGDAWTRSDNWLSPAALGEWHGVAGDSLGRVVALDLADNGLSGLLPAALGNLGSLAELRLGSNALSGSLPTALAHLPLSALHYAGTELCAPDDRDFRAWLEAIPSHQGTDVECGPVTERVALEILHATTGGDTWTRADNWLSDAPLGEWYGVGTDDAGTVVSLELGSNGLSGAIPPELGDLASLTRLYLHENGLSGPIPPELGDLTGLTRLYLHENGLSGAIPPELGDLAGLTRLYLHENQLSGPIPPELGNLTGLLRLYLDENALAGPIPPELGSLTSLERLYLNENGFSGPIPPELGDLANLTRLYLDQNGLTGPIPPELGVLTDLTHLVLGSNDLSGSIPPELGNLASLTRLNLDKNNLSGPIPREFGELTRLAELYLRENALSGPIPPELVKLAGLAAFHFDANPGLCAPGAPRFVAWLAEMDRHYGPLCNAGDRDALQVLHAATGGDTWTRSANWLSPAALGEWHGVASDSLGRVTALDLADNGLSGLLPAALGNLGSLTELRLGGNALSGSLPRALVRLPLGALHYAGTELCAPGDRDFRAWLESIPSHQGTDVACGPVSERGTLETLYAATGGEDWTRADNWLSDAPLGEWYGVRTDDAGTVVSLELGWNGLSGSIPPEIGDLAGLTRLDLRSNNLFGPIPPEIGDLVRLTRLYLTRNRLSGPIPPEVGNLLGLTRMYLQENDLSGPIPPGLGNLVRLTRLHLHENALSGPIPPKLGNLADLTNLYLYHNALSGPVPPELGHLASLRHLDLGSNNLSGPVPPELGELSALETLGLAQNLNLDGILPLQLAQLAKLRSLQAGGTGLCAPDDPGFRAWLAHVPERWIASCDKPFAAYLTQAVQSRRFPVPLVAGEPALLRVFITVDAGADARIPPARATFYLDGVEAHVANISQGSGPIPAGIDESDLALSANALIPAAIVRPGLEAIVELDPAGTLDPALGVAPRIPSAGRLAFDVREMPRLDLTVIPFLWTGSSDSTIIATVEEMATDPEAETLLLTRRILPVAGLDVTAHPPVLTSRNDKFVLLGETSAIRRLEAGTGHYMGTMVGDDLAVGGGVAALPGRVSFSSPWGSTIAHELGHNFSLPHAPCGRPTGIDPSFPYPGGNIGAWGYDFRRAALIPPRMPDVMSYCGPRWISDYNFTKAARFRLADEGPSAAADIPPRRGLLVWGGVDPEGLPFLEPAFAVNAPPALPTLGGTFRLEGRGHTGDIVFAFDFDMPETADADGAASFSFVIPVVSGSELAAITLEGPDGTATLDADTHRPMAILRDPQTGSVRAILRDTPTAARARTAAAALADGNPDAWEVLFSRGIPNPGG